MSDIVMWNGSKRLQTCVTDVAKNTVTIRSLDWDRDRFDIEFGLSDGTTYNAYLIFGADKTALVETSHEKFRGPFMEVLKEQLAKAGRGVDYILCSHTEPDHSGLVGDVVALYPDAVVIGSKVCISFLKNLVHSPFKEKVVKGGEKIDLGGGHVLEFVMAPNLHWPDTIFTYDHATGIMYTCDAFGMHYCSEDPYDSHLEPLDSHYRYYYDCLMRPNAKSVCVALRKVKDLPYTAIGTGHGPMLRYNVPELVGRYKSWSEDMTKSPTSVAVLYTPDYGFSDRLSQTLAHGITKAGVATEMVDMLSVDPMTGVATEMVDMLSVDPMEGLQGSQYILGYVMGGVATEMVDILSVDPMELAETVGRSAGLVVMAPPSDSEECRAALNTMVTALKKQKVLIAESFGGRDEPVDTLLQSLVGVGVEPLGDPLRVKDVPTEGIYQLFEEAGTDMAQALTQKDHIAQIKAAMSTDVAKALARVSGGLYIVTAAHPDAKSAMVASWVAQASFEPLGLTIAVAKDRAIESLMQVGDVFVLNCLAEGEYGPTLKHFLQRFPAGADRFEGVDWTPLPGCGTPVLGNATAYMQCKVVSRMETADHWVTYAEVVDGQVLQPEKQTAVHRRKEQESDGDCMLWVLQVANYY
ncbi:hypothetical protein N2152v2_010966 [Parachlorella kessleri]